MISLVSLRLLKLGGPIGIGVGILALIVLFKRPDFPPVRWYRQYCELLDTYTRFLWLDVSAQQVVLGQVAAVACIAILAFVAELPFWWAFLGAAALGPIAYFYSKKKKRVEQLEAQVDGFLLAYANALKVVPNPAAALGIVVGVLDDPIRQEVDRALKEMRVGATLSDALLNMAARANNRILDSGLCSVHIGIHVGGDLPGILASTAAVLREMQRLEGVVRTKTAQARSQLWLLGVMPFVMGGIANMGQPGFFEPLTQSFTGYVVAVIMVVLWVTAIVIARKILAVDL